MTDATFIVLNGQGNAVQFVAEETGGRLVLLSAPSLDGEPVSPTNPLPVVFSSAGTTKTAEVGDNHVVTTGGTAVVAFAGGSIVSGAFITNPFDEGNFDSIFVDLVNAPTTDSPPTNGTTIELGRGATFEVPGGLTGPVRVNAANNGHAFIAVRF